MPEIENIQEQRVPPGVVEDSTVELATDEPAREPFPTFLVVFLVATALSAAFCLPSIITGVQKVRSTPTTHPIVQEHREAQELVRDNMRRLESAVENPQGE